MRSKPTCKVLHITGVLHALPAKPAANPSRQCWMSTNTVQAGSNCFAQITQTQFHKLSLAGYQETSRALRPWPPLRCTLRAPGHQTCTLRVSGLERAGVSGHNPFIHVLGIPGQPGRAHPRCCTGNATPAGHLEGSSSSPMADGPGT